MSDKEPKKKLVGPWQSLHGAIWLIGLYYMFTHNAWWPGILVLIAISAAYEAILRILVPQAFIEEQPSPSTNMGQSTVDPVPPSTPVATPPPAPTIQEHRLDLLPQVCPNCNAPIRGHEVKWTGPQSANCPYCGTNLPMSKA